MKLKTKSKKGIIPIPFIIAGLIIGAVVVAFNYSPQLLSIIGSYDKYETEFDPYSETGICKGLNSEYTLVTRTFEIQDGKIELPESNKIRMFCGIGADINYNQKTNEINIGRLEGYTDYFELDIGIPIFSNYIDWVGDNSWRAKGLAVDDKFVSRITGRHLEFCGDTSTLYVEQPVTVNPGQNVYTIYNDNTLYFDMPSSNPTKFRNSNKLTIPLSTEYESIIITAIEQITGENRGVTSTCTPSIPDKVYFTANDWPNNQITLTYAIPSEQISTETHYRTESCPLPEGFVLATESFAPGSVVSVSSLRYPPAFFCQRHPAIITSLADSSTEVCPGESCSLAFDPYSRLVDGGALSVGEGETLTLFYVIRADESLPIVCDVSDSVYDTELDKCVKQVHGVLHVCSEGNFDPATGLCLVQADIEQVCEVGRYDVAQQKCIYHPEEKAVCDVGELSADGKFCIYQPDLRNECPIGSFDPDRNACVVTPDINYLCINGVYDPDQNVCMIIPAETIYCRDGFTYDFKTDKCVRYPESAVKCLDGYTYNSDENECQMTPEHEIDCPENTIYKRGKCVYEPDVIVNCPVGSEYDSEQNICVATTHKIVCNDGYRYDSELQACVKPGKVISWWEAFLVWLKNVF